MGVSAPLALALICGTPFGLGVLAAQSKSAKPAQKANPDPFAYAVPLLRKYCVTCHAGASAPAGLKLDGFRDSASVTRNRHVWDEAVGKIRSGQMPPPGALQPPKKDREALLAAILKTLASAPPTPIDPGRPTLRRLNRAEYDNTVRDLFGIELKLAEDFPSDDVGYGFDNIGDVLSLSPLLMEKYLDAAEKIAAEVVRLPDLRTRTYDAETLDTDTGRARDDNSVGLYSAGRVWAEPNLELSGTYKVRVVAWAQQAGPELAKMSVRIDGKEVAVFEVRARQGEPANYEPPLVELGAGRRRIAAAFTNDYYRPEDPDPANRDRNLFVQSIEIVGPLGPPRAPPAAHSRLMIAQPDAADPMPAARAILSPFLKRCFRRPVTREEVERYAGFVTQAKKEGLPFEQGIRLALQAALVSPHFLFRVELDILPPQVAKPGGVEVSKSSPPQVAKPGRGGVSKSSPPQVAKPGRGGVSKSSPPQGAKPGRGGVSKSSPPQGAKREGEGAGGGGLRAQRAAQDAIRPLTPHELASRLSYFLWSSMPDDDLFRLADSRELLKPDVLAAQAKRMLRSPKARALTDNFAAQWLTLRKLDSVTPDPTLFPGWSEELRKSMRQETDLFFRHVVAQDRPVTEFLDADYTFLDDALAKHYGFSITSPLEGEVGNPGVPGEPGGGTFRLVRLPKGPRAGILTHASILTLTSNPNRTSPVKRGKWILENILGTAPPPPPPGLDSLAEGDAKSPTRSIKARMKEHRANPECAVCHARMDPVGFAFENFDAVGKWRTKDGAFPVDASDTLPDGIRLNGPASLRALLLQRKGDFVRTLAEKLLTYALGRGLTSADKPAVEKVLQAARASDYKMSQLIGGVVLSAPFRNRRVSP